ncbi:sensor histidine kinase [Catellatospora sichuanensis]|uniref:sensor histidine kinase n=1 Tax=Catellatospora sichuanensis TaxID=1969805 RepID=UPI001FE2960B|nr:ATP-binding protein [Catellatospora sichuanensis]
MPGWLPSAWLPSSVGAEPGDNGVRHNVAAGGRLLVSTTSRGDGTVELRVANTGPVIPRYEVPSLFEPFHRYGGDRLAAAPGAGLGLSIVRAVARAHGGDVRAVPGEGGGLVVTVTLPRAAALDEELAGTPEAAARR